MKKRVLFITKKYPPSVGGEEQYCFDLFHCLQKQNKVDIDLIAKSPGHRIARYFFYLGAFLKALFNNRKYDICFLSGGSLAPIGAALKLLTGKRIIIAIHGKDITDNKMFYQNIIPKLVGRFDRIICVSSNTKNQCVSRGIDGGKIEVIHNGIDFENFDSNILTREEWIQKYHIDPSRKIVITIGRLVEHKGVEWFIRNILADFKVGDYQYFIIGKGVMKEKIEETIRQNQLNHRVFLIGEIAGSDKNSFYAYSDLKIMPNIYVDGDAEGFGIVAIEAGAWGLPVLTSGIEGIKDAVIPGISGFFYKDAGDLKRIFQKFLDGDLRFKPKDEIREFVKEKYSLSKLANRYVEIFEEK